jgi:glycosyltransferase involved in cell wall biosynthesis
MNVLITSDIFPPDVGGPATFVPTLATYLAQRGYRVTVLTWSRHARHPADDGYAFRVDRIPRWRFRMARLARLFPRLLTRARDSDVIFVNGALFATWLVNTVSRRPIAAKVVGDLAWEYAQLRGISDDLHTFSHQRYAASVEWRRRLQSRALQAMDAVVVPSRYLARLVASWGVAPEGIEVIPNAVALPAPTAGGQPARSRPPGDGPRRLVTVGRLVPHKRVDEIIGVLPELSGVELMVIGDGPERAALQAHARRLQCDDRVTFMGSLPPPQVMGRLREADVFVLNSRYEGFPHVVLEAFGASVPVVATAVGGTPELVRHEDSGLLVPPGDAAKLRQAIARVLEDCKLRGRLVEGGHATVADRSPADMLTATEALLVRVGGGRATFAGSPP